VLLGGVAGGIASAALIGWTWFLDRRSEMFRDFLVQGLAIQALREAWMLDGPGAQTSTLAQHPNLPRRPDEGGLWLHQVEIRAVLDQAKWNAPGKDSYYGFIAGRRSWIVRNTVQPERSFAGPALSPKQPSYPALLSSQAVEELCGWIEQVASVNRRVFLGEHACRALFHQLACVSGEDRIAFFGHRLSDRATDFLRWYHKRYANPPEQPG